MDREKIILKNFPHHGQYDESSFLGKLHELQLWDIEEYWLLEWAIYNLEKCSSGKLNCEVFRIFSFIMLSISSALDENDFFEIKNLQRGEIYEFRERVQLVFEGYFSKSMPNKNLFERVNPRMLNVF